LIELRANVDVKHFIIADGHWSTWEKVSDYTCFTSSYGIRHRTRTCPNTHHEALCSGRTGQTLHCVPLTNCKGEYMFVIHTTHKYISIYKYVVNHKCNIE